MTVLAFDVTICPRKKACRILSQPVNAVGGSNIVFEKLRGGIGITGEGRLNVCASACSFMSGEADLLFRPGLAQDNAAGRM